jgi:hypothetical protein
MPANITGCPPWMLVAGNPRRRKHQQLLDQAAPDIVHQFVDTRAGVLDQIE